MALDYPHWDELDRADRLWIAALEAEEAGVPAMLVATIREAAEKAEAAAGCSGTALASSVTSTHCTRSNQ